MISRSLGKQRATRTSIVLLPMSIAARTADACCCIKASSALNKRRTTIDTDFRTGDMAGSIRCQEEDKLSDLHGSGRFPIAQRNLAFLVLNRKLDALQVFLLRVVLNFGLCPSGADDVHADVMRCQFHGEHF